VRVATSHVSAINGTENATAGTPSGRLIAASPTPMDTATPRTSVHHIAARAPSR
jgi:hypothetical protein